MQGEKYKPKYGEKKILLSKPKFELFKEDYQTFLISVWFVKIKEEKKII